MNKHRKYVIVAIGIIVVIPFLLFKTVFSKTVTVVDADTGKRIEGATVTYQYANWADGCGKPQIVQTNVFGRATPTSSFWICAVNAVAPGYHINGVNNGFVRKIKLYKQISNDTPIQFSKVFTKDTGMDVLAYIASYNNTETPKDQSNDFVITDLESTVTVLPDGNESINGITNPAHIHFLGEGGIQAISDSKSISTGGEYYFDMENMRTAPDDGYKKEMDIYPLKPYVAKLRDGKHYMKFHMFASQNYKTKVDQICITGFVGSQPGESLDFLNTSSTSTFCSNDRLPEDYAKKMTYKKFQKDFSGTIIAKKYDSNVTSMEDANGYRYLMNYNSPTSSSLDDIVYNYTFTTVVPSFEEFSQKFDENKGGGQIPLLLLLAHADKTYKALVNIPIYGFEREPNTGAPHSTKELCDRDLAGAAFTSTEIKKQVFDKCLTHSFGYN